MHPFLIRTAAAGILVLASVGAAHASSVGYYGRCSSNSSPVAQIALAGGTARAVATLDTASLAGLDTLLVLNCSFSSNAAVDAAVASGMTLIVHDWSPSATSGARLPGAPIIPFVYAGGSDINVPAGSPIATGPGGTLTNASLDGGTSSNHGYANVASLPAGVDVLTTTGNSAQAVTVAYAYGQGNVIYGAMPLDHYLPGGVYDQLGLCTTNPVCSGMQAYLTNLIAWNGDFFTSCAAEGFRGSKLTLCHQVCEMNYSGAKLKALITVWTHLYREDPPCAR